MLTALDTYNPIALLSQETDCIDSQCNPSYGIDLYISAFDSCVQHLDTLNNAKDAYASNKINDTALAFTLNTVAAFLDEPSLDMEARGIGNKIEDFVAKLIIKAKKIFKLLVSEFKNRFMGSSRISSKITDVKAAVEKLGLDDKDSATVKGSVLIGAVMVGKPSMKDLLNWCSTRPRLNMVETTSDLLVKGLDESANNLFSGKSSEYIFESLLVSDVAKRVTSDVSRFVQVNNLATALPYPGSWYYKVNIAGPNGTAFDLMRKVKAKDLESQSLFISAKEVKALLNMLESSYKVGEERYKKMNKFIAESEAKVFEMITNATKNSDSGQSSTLILSNSMKAVSAIFGILKYEVDCVNKATVDVLSLCVNTAKLIEKEKK